MARCVRDRRPRRTRPPRPFDDPPRVRANAGPPAGDQPQQCPDSSKRDGGPVWRRDRHHECIHPPSDEKRRRVRGGRRPQPARVRRSDHDGLGGVSTARLRRCRRDERRDRPVPGIHRIRPRHDAGRVLGAQPFPRGGIGRRRRDPEAGQGGSGHQGGGWTRSVRPRRRRPGRGPRPGADAVRAGNLETRSRCRGHRRRRSTHGVVPLPGPCAGRHCVEARPQPPPSGASLRGGPPHALRPCVSPRMRPL